MRPNAATANAARLDAAIAARDADALADPVRRRRGGRAPSHRRRVRPAGSARHAGARCCRAEDVTLRHEPLATLGDSLALCRAVVVGRVRSVESETVRRRRRRDRDAIVLIEVDAHGRRRRAEFFAADRLGDAVARLYERYAELLPDGPARARAAATARSVAAHARTVRPRSLRRGVRARRRVRRPPDRRVRVRARSRSGAARHPRLARARRRRRHARRRRPRPAVRRAPRALDDLGHRPRQRRRLRATVPHALGLRSRRPRDAHRAVRRRPRRRGARPLRRADGRSRRARPRAACGRTPRPRTPRARCGRRDRCARRRRVPRPVRRRRRSIDHTTGTAYGPARQCSLSMALAAERHETCVSRHEPLATLGDSLALCRRMSFAERRRRRANFDVGAYERGRSS